MRSDWIEFTTVFVNTVVNNYSNVLLLFCEWHRFPVRWSGRHTAYKLLQTQATRITAEQNNANYYDVNESYLLTVG